MRGIWFLISGSLLFVLAGPPIGGMVFWAATLATLHPPPDVEKAIQLLAFVLLYCYLAGLVPALMSGVLCCAAMLAVAKLRPAWLHAGQTRRRLGVALAIGVLPSLISGAFMAKGSAGVIKVVTLLVPSIICAVFVGWRVMPQLGKPGGAPVSRAPFRPSAATPPSSSSLDAK